MMKFSYCLFYFALSIPLFGIAQTTSSSVKIDFDFYINFAQKSHNKSTLYIEDTVQLFEWGNTPTNIKADPESDNFSISLYVGDSIGNYNFTDLKKDSIYSRLIWLKGKIYHVEEKKTNIQWNIMNETKRIASFNCQKAVGEFRGRKYIAWFTTELPIIGAPWKLHGLPGLVLAAHDEENKVQFIFKSISTSKTKIIDDSILEEDAERISLSEFAGIQKSIDKELSKIILSKVPRGARVNIKKKETIEIFN